MNREKENKPNFSSLPSTLRIDNPGLVTANELDTWASRLEAKGSFPELMRRLLSATPGISNLQIRANEGVSAPGWDGTAVSTGSAFLPAGNLYFEFGTDARPKEKAQRDFDKRVSSPSVKSNSVFIFVTPRNWPGAVQWVPKHSEEANFTEVKAVDAHILEGWLQATPAVHRWISERLGYSPEGAITLEQWWESFQNRIQIKLPDKFFLAGRTQELEELQVALSSSDASSKIITVESRGQDEALAFIFASLAQKSNLLERSVVVTDITVWNQIISSNSPMVLIPLFDDETNLTEAIGKGHHIILIARPHSTKQYSPKIVLQKIGHRDATEILKPVVSDSSIAENMVTLARRSMPAFIRSIAVDPRIRIPEWTTNPQKFSTLALLVLVGSWTSSNSDLAVLEKLTRQSREDIDRLLMSFSESDDAPFTQSGEVWQTTSPQEASILLLHKLTQPEIARWEEVVRDVLLEPDPFQDMDPVQRLSASVQGSESPLSEILRDGLATGLIVATLNEDTMRHTDLALTRKVRVIVRTLLQTANSDETGATWVRIATILPHLAEAAPEEFLDEVEKDLNRTNPILHILFKDYLRNELWGNSLPYPSLLWALEILCWSPEYFGQATAILAKLAGIDPNGQLINRPITSLQNAVTAQLPLSGATIDNKIAVIERTLNNQPDIGWQITLGILSNTNASAIVPSNPKYRDWRAPLETIYYTDLLRYIHRLVDLAISSADVNPERWKELIQVVRYLPSEDIGKIQKNLKKVVTNNSWSANEIYLVWHTICDTVELHKYHLSSQWSISVEQIDKFQEIANILEASLDERKYARLFDSQVRIAAFNALNEESNAEIKDIRYEALNQILKLGTDSLLDFVQNIEAPYIVGELLAENPITPEQEILKHINSPILNVRKMILSFAESKMHSIGIQWLKNSLKYPAFKSLESRELIISVAPANSKFWRELPILGSDLKKLYWTHINIYRIPTADYQEGIQLLLQNQNPWGAIILLQNILYREDTLEIDIFKESLNKILIEKIPPKDRGQTLYALSEILQFMEQSTPDDPDLPDYEFILFSPDSEIPSSALYRSLGKNSDNFVEIVKSCCRSDLGERNSYADSEKHYRSHCFSILWHWKLLPGLNESGEINTQHLTNWVNESREAFTKSGYTLSGDYQIGQVLASSPVGSDGIWPAEPVRDIIESLSSRHINNGLYIGKINKRGVTSRDPFVGGDQERKLELEYKSMASKLNARWPQTASILRRIANSYYGEAHHHDLEAEYLGDRI